jgi:hypothetical protein
MECDMEYVPLDSGPEYFALSYVWGDPAVTMPMVLNGIRHEVTANLHEALTHVRKTNNRVEEWYYWVDALCINQADGDEKSKQIPRMRDIFTRTRRVIAWIGPNDREVNEMTQELFDLAWHIYCEAPSFVELQDYPIDDVLGDRFQPLADLLAFNILHRPCFTRIWVAQEMALSKADPLIICGDCIVCFEPFFMLLIAFSSHLEMPHLDLQAAWVRRELLRFRSARAEAQEQIVVKEQTEATTAQILFRVILSLAGCEATCPHDMVYGVLGFVESSLLPSHLLPNYQLPLGKVYHQYRHFFFATITIWTS